MQTQDWDKAAQKLYENGATYREGQTLLGQAVFDAINNKTSLVAVGQTGIGKSFCAAIPLITRVLEAKKKDKTFRAAISTETIALQNQIAEKDLPFLSTLYPGFVFKKLMGRSNYLCLNTMQLSAIASNDLEKFYQLLEKRISDLGSGEIKDVERVLHQEISPEIWSRISGSMSFCVDNDCEEDKCFAARARNKALEADIVVVNHALLGIDADLKSQGLEEGLLGILDTIIVDEAHALEPVLVSQWTEEVTHWQISNYIDSIVYTVDRCNNIKNNLASIHHIQVATENVHEIFGNIHEFFERVTEDSKEPWDNFEAAISMKYMSGSISDKLRHALHNYEDITPQLIKETLEKFAYCKNFIDTINSHLQQSGAKIPQKRKFNKGFRSLKELTHILNVLNQALQTKDGIIDDFGKVGVIFNGWMKKDLSHGYTLRLTPLDVSYKAMNIWKQPSTSILLSATLTDLTDGTFTYARKCVGFPNGPEISVSSPFDYQTKQLIYVTTGEGKKVDGGQYCLDELVSLVQISNGRSLILFTAKKELEFASKALHLMQINNKFPYKILVQENGNNKQKLLDEFKSDTHSVLLGLKSFFVGIDVPGEALSQVIICKFPLAKFSIECRMRMSVWAKKEFPRWYERESLTTLAQAAGRLIRTTDDRGVISLLDFRVINPAEKVHQTAKLGLNSLGSPITRDINVVNQFLNSYVQS